MWWRGPGGGGGGESLWSTLRILFQHSAWKALNYRNSTFIPELREEQRWLGEAGLQHAKGKKHLKLESVWHGGEGETKENSLTGL